MLTSHQIKLVENSWDHVLVNSKEAGNIFYKKLFSIDPSLRQMFKGDIVKQSEKLVAMITFAVHKLRHLDDITTDIKALGIKHNSILVREEHYTIAATALIWTLEQALGERWNNEIRDAWITVYNELSKTMIEAAMAG